MVIDMSEDFSQADQDQIRAAFVEEALNDLEKRNEQFQFTVMPLGDSIGWRAEFNIVDADNTLFLAGASHTSALAAISIAAARASVAFDEFVKAVAEAETDVTSDQVDETEDGV